MELETSKRAIYGDIATLMERRVPIHGEAGTRYALEKGFDGIDIVRLRAHVHAGKKVTRGEIVAAPPPPRGRMSENANPCQSCGACCAYSANWPRFTIEDDATLDRIPADFVNERLSGMRCDGDRCCALTGSIGVTTACAIYALRPEVCRTCQPGDAECAMARRRFGLGVLAVSD
jgi:uncharacterized protein